MLKALTKKARGERQAELFFGRCTERLRRRLSSRGRRQRHHDKIQKHFFEWDIVSIARVIICNTWLNLDEVLCEPGNVGKQAMFFDLMDELEPVLGEPFVLVGRTMWRDKMSFKAL